MKWISCVATLLYLYLPAHGQQDFRIMSFNKFEQHDLATGTFEELDNDFIPAVLGDRFDLMGYKPIKFDGLRVISSHQPNSNFDVVYFIDKSGHATKKIMASTAPHNFDNGSRAYHDSMNPYGSNDMPTALLNGLLRAVFNRGISFK